MKKGKVNFIQKKKIHNLKKNNVSVSFKRKRYGVFRKSVVRVISQKKGLSWILKRKKFKVMPSGSRFIKHKKSVYYYHYWRKNYYILRKKLGRKSINYFTIKNNKVFFYLYVTIRRPKRGFKGRFRKKKNGILFSKWRRRKRFNWKKLKVLFNGKKKLFRIFDSFVNRRLFIYAKKNRNSNKNSLLFLKKNSVFRWKRSFKLLRKLRNYSFEVRYLESLGLKRRIYRRRRTLYSLDLQNKKKIKMFYFKMKESLLKNLVIKALKIRNKRKKFFLLLLEGRLDVLLFRLGIGSNYFSIRKFIKLGRVLVNDVEVVKFSYILLPGDVISFKPKKLDIPSFRKRLSLIHYPSNYIEVSFSLFKFYFYKCPLADDISYFCDIDINRVLTFLRSTGV